MTNFTKRLVQLGFGSFFGILAAVLSSGTAHATCYEVGLEVKNGGSYVSIPITIYDGSGTQIYSGTSTSTPDGNGANFMIDLNGGCPGMPNLTPGVQYVIKFSTWGATYFTGHLGGTNDGYYVVTPTTISFDKGQDLETFAGYTCAMTGLSLAITNTQVVGDKTTFTLTATATAGCTPLTFAWTNVSAQVSGIHVNPNVANRTMLRNDTETVTVTVTDNSGGHLTKSIVLDTHP